MKRTESHLIQQVRRGDPEAFALLMARHRSWAYRLAYHLMGDPEEAEDQTQEAFIRAFLHLNQLRDPACFGPWLRQIVQHLCWNCLQARSRSQDVSLDALPELSGDIPDPSSAVEEQVIQRQFQQVLIEEIGRLAEPHRQAWVLYHLEGFTYQGLADALDLPLGTVKMRLYRARRKLWEQVQGRLQGP